MICKLDVKDALKKDVTNRLSGIANVIKRNGLFYIKKFAYAEGIKEVAAVNKQFSEPVLKVNEATRQVRVLIQDSLVDKYYEVANPLANVKRTANFQGTLVEFVDHIPTDKSVPVAMRNVNKGEKILIVEDLMLQKFNEKAWTKPVTQRDGSKVTPLPVDAFTTVDEWILFALKHEKAHETIFKSENETIGQYEDRINRAALNNFISFSPNVSTLASTVKLTESTNFELKSLKQEQSRLLDQRKQLKITSSDYKQSLAKVFDRINEINTRIDEIELKGNIYNEAKDYDDLDRAFELDFKRLQKLLNAESGDLSVTLRNLEEAQRIVNFYTQIGDFSSGENYLFTDTSLVSEEEKKYWQEKANIVQDYQKSIIDQQKDVLVDMVEANPSVQKYLNDKGISLTFGLLTQPAKDTDWLSMKTIMPNESFFVDQLLIVDVLVDMAKEYEEKGIRLRREITSKLDDLIGAIRGKHTNYQEFKQLDSDGKFTGNIIFPFSQLYWDKRSEELHSKYNLLNKLTSLETRTAIQNRTINKLVKEIKKWKLENEILIDIRKIPEIKSAYPDLVREFDLDISDQNRQEYKQFLIKHLGERSYIDYVERQKNHITEYQALLEEAKRQASEDLELFVESLGATEPITSIQDALLLWGVLYNPFFAPIDFYGEKPLHIYINGDLKPVSQVSNLRSQLYRHTDTIPRKYTGNISNSNSIYRVEDTNVLTGYYDTRFDTITNDADLYAFWRFAIHNLSLAKKMMPYAYQQNYQINTIPFIEQTILEQFTSKGLVNVAYSKAYDTLIKSLTDNELSTQTFDENPFSDSQRTINYTFLGTREKLEDKLYQEYAIEYFIKSKLGIASEKDIATLDPNIQQNVWNELKKLRKKAQFDIASKASFDLGSVLKFYLGTMVAFNQKEQILPTLSFLEKNLQSIRQVETNRAGQPVKDKLGQLKTTDIPVVRRIQRTGYFLDVYTNQPTQEQEAITKKELYTKEERDDIKRLEALKEEADDAQKQAIQVLINSYGQNITGSGTVDTALSYLRFLGLGWNLSAQIPNAAAGYFANFGMAADGRIVKMSALKRAYNFIWHIAMPSFLKSKANQEAYNKFKELMYRGDFLLDATSEMQKSRLRSEVNAKGKLDWLSPYAPTRFMEYINQGTLVLGRMMTNTIEDTNGKFIPLWDALDENLELKPEFRTESNVANWSWDGDLMIKETQLIRKLIADTHGDYTESGRQYAKRKVLGRMALFFKTWLPNAMKVRFGKEKYDLNYGMWTKGRYRSYTPGQAAVAGATLGTWLAPGIGSAIGYGVGMTLGKLFGNDINDSVLTDVKDSATNLGRLLQRLYWSKISRFNPNLAAKVDQQFEGEFDEVDAANLRANLHEIQFMLTMLLVYFIAKAALYDDDEDKKNQLVHNYMINQIVKIQNDLVFYTSPQTPGKFVEQLIPLTRLVDQSFSLMNSANKVIFNMELESNEDSFMENLIEQFPKPVPSTKMLERTFSEPTMLKKIFENE